MSCMIQRFQFLLISLLATCGSIANGQGTASILQTGGENPIVSSAVPLVLEGNSILSFRFGFTTDESVMPEIFLDSFSVSLSDDLGGYAPIATLDASGAYWAPAGGTVALTDEEIFREPIELPSSVTPLAQQLAWFVMVPIPEIFQGKPLTLYFDLFDNGNEVNSVAWFSDVTVQPVPEPEARWMALTGLLLLWWRFRRK